MLACLLCRLVEKAWLSRVDLVAGMTFYDLTIIDWALGLLKVGTLSHLLINYINLCTGTNSILVRM